MKPTYHIWTIGCQMNEADSRILAADLESAGYQPARNERAADVFVLNTCVVRQQAEDKIYERLRHVRGLKHRKPETVVALMGCLVGRKLDPALKERFPFVDVFMPPSDTAPLMDYLSRPRTVTDRTHSLALPYSSQGQAIAAYVPVVLGCSHACTFCVIPSRRGAEHSRPKADILEEIRSLAGQGVREITLIGQIVDRYGLDLQDPLDLAGLLEEISTIDRLLRIRFLTSHPAWFTDKLLEAVASVPKVCPHIEIPLQAGHDEVLARMKRGYTADQYRRLIGKIRGRIPDAGIFTDIIVGFPGETETQFMATYELMREIQFDMAHIAKYSERPGTFAARNYPDDISAEEKERRHDLLEELLAKSLTEKNQRLAGRKVEVLVEERSARGRWGGRTPQNKPVFFEAPGNLHGQLVGVTIDRPGPFSFAGHVEADGKKPA